MKRGFVHNIAEATTEWAEKTGECPYGRSIKENLAWVLKAYSAPVTIPYNAVKKTLHPNTVESVAEELVEGLKSGEIVLDKDNQNYRSRG